MSVTPDFIGQRYKDINTGNIWIANSTTPGDWTLEVQNMQIKWEPKSLKLGQGIGLYCFEDMGASSLEILGATLKQNIDLENTTALVALSIPNATTISTADIISLRCSANTALTSISAPLLASVAGGILIEYNNALTSVSFPSLAQSDTAITVYPNTTLSSVDFTSLQTISAGDFVLDGNAITTLSLPSLVSVTAGYLSISGNPITDLSIPNFLPTNTKHVYCDGCALNAASVNHVLARCVANAAYVSGTVHLNGGTNAAPSGQGIIDKGILVGRGVVVSNN